LHRSFVSSRSDVARNQGLLHVAPDNIERDTGRLLECRTIAQAKVTSGKYRFEPGDLLYSKIRPNLNKVARVDFPGLCSADMYALQVDEKRVVPSFLAYVLRSPRFLRYAAGVSNRANIPKLNRDQLMRFRFELPGLDEQGRIGPLS
jgi:type I restriction enzyme S subunit